MLELVVGLFVCLGVGAIFVLTLRVSSLQGLEGGPTYSVTAAFENIGGLKPGAKVSIGGVGIGRVTGISYDQKSFQAIVTMKVDQKYDQIPKDSSASILTSGLLGEKYIGLTPGGSLQSLANGDRIKFTQSALILERIIGQVLFNKAQETQDK